MKLSWKMILSSVVLAIILLSSVGIAGQVEPGYWPQEYNVKQDKDAGIVRLSTPYYTIEHNVKKGGAISKVNLTHGQVDNLLVAPVESRVRLWSKGTGMTKDTFSDLNDPKPAVSVVKDGKNVTVTVKSKLLDVDGKDSGVSIETIYSYRWGYIKIHKEFVAKKTVKLRNLCVLSTINDGSLEDYGYRPAIFEVVGSSTHSWQSDQIRRWGKMRPGTHFDLPFRTRYIPRYIVLANHGIEGIEWFSSDDLAQWDYQVPGKPGSAYCEISPSTNPLGNRLSICPLDIAPRYELQKGGYVEFKGMYEFDYYLAVPILQGHANKPWMNKSYAVNKGDWVSDEQIKQNADDGIVTMHLHNDGDHHGDGMFWRDGSYPPYPAEEMKKMDKTIKKIHDNGMKTMPYFSNHELHQSTDEFKKYGDEWGRKPDDRGNIRPNYYYGALMCLKSGWLDCLKRSIDRVLTNHDFDGVYYDWNIAMYCNNPEHVCNKSNGVVSDKGIGGYAISETGHWDIDGLIDLSEWTRKRVGKDGVIILHNTLVPMFATENFANYVVGMEFTYGKLSVSMPKPHELPLEWSFVQARPRAVIGYGTITKDAPKRLRKQHAITTLMTSVAPWPASEEAINLFEMLEPLGDIEDYKFQDWRNEAIKINDNDIITALYSKQGLAYLLIANTSDKPKNVNCIIDPTKMSYPLKSIKFASVMASGMKLDPAKLTTTGQTIEMSADDVIMLQIKNR